MDHTLQKVVGSQRISILDRFSGYNQILLHHDHQEKKKFTTPWGTFMYSKMPFNLINAWVTFQRAMDITFAEEKDRFVVIYLDDIIVYWDSDLYFYLLHIFAFLIPWRWVESLLKTSVSNIQCNNKSQSLMDNTEHLKNVFLKCRKFGISLNPKKSHFVMLEGKLIGHIISKDGINIDSSRVE